MLAGQGRGKASSGCSEEASLSQRSGGWRGAGGGRCSDPGGAGWKVSNPAGCGLRKVLGDALGQTLL